MRNFADRLVTRIADLNNPTVMGLDPKLEYIPKSIIDKALLMYPDDVEVATAEAIWMFNQALIDATYDIVPAIKPQEAFYEFYGIEALKVLDRTVKYAQEKGMLVIVDCKRNDIGNTAAAYSEGILGSTEIIDGSTPVTGRSSPLSASSPKKTIPDTSATSSP